MQSLLPKGHHKTVDYLLIFASLLFFMMTTYVWLAHDTQVIAWDPIGHFFRAVQAYEILGTGGWRVVFRLATFSAEYPPFVYLVTIPFISVERSLYWATMTNMAFLAMILFSTYGIAKRLFANRAAALFSVLMVGMYPQVFTIARVYLLDLGLTAMVAVAFYFLVDPALLESKLRLSTLGIILGFGMLTKWTFPIYVLIPLVYSLVVPVLKKPEARKRFLLVPTIAGAISVPWYATHVMDLKAALYLKSEWWSVTGAVPPSPVVGLSYIVLLINNQVSLVLFLLFVAGLVALLLAKGTPGLLLLLSWAVPFIVLSIPSNIDARFTLPLLPIVAIISSSILLIPRPRAPANIFRPATCRRVKIILVTAIMFFSIFQFSITSYGVPDLWSSGPAVDTPIGWIILLPPCATVTGPPSTADWKIDKILLSIYADGKLRGHSAQGNVNVEVLVDHVYFDVSVFQYYAYILKLPITMLGSGAWGPDSAIEQLARSDYVVTKSFANASTPGLQKNMNIVFSFFKGRMDDYKLLLSTELPDGSIARVYRRESTPCRLLTRDPLLIERMQRTQQTRHFLCRLGEEYYPAHIAGGDVRVFD